MSRSGHYSECDVAELDLAAIEQGSTKRGQGRMGDANTHDGANLLIHVLIDVEVFVIGFRT